jgi:hypothetical protein
LHGRTETGINAKDSRLEIDIDLASGVAFITDIKTGAIDIAELSGASWRLETEKKQEAKPIEPEATPALGMPSSADSTAPAAKRPGRPRKA